MLILSIILINIALIAYSISILRAAKIKTLALWNIILFYIGLICDLSGTFIMYKIGGSKLRIGVHDIFGYCALLFMLINAIGFVYIFKNDTSVKRWFFKFSVFAWIIWVASYLLGIIAHA